MTRNIPGERNTDDGIRPVPNATLPYWRTELHHLDEYRSTDKLPAHSDIVIIGAGLAGVATAYHLLNMYEPGTEPSITLLEARQVCSGATGRNGGHTKVKTTSLLGMKKAMGLEAAEEFVEFVSKVMYGLKGVVEKERLECEFELRRSFDVFCDEEEATEMEGKFRQAVANGEKWTKERDWVPRERVEQVTSIKPAKAAISVPACSLWPYKFVTQLLSRIISRLNLQTNTPVLSISTSNHITTPHGTLTANKIIFATNGYTAGICPTYKDKIVPVRITASHLKAKHPISPHLTHTYNIAYTPDRVDYLNPRPDGSIVVGGGKWKYLPSGKKNWYNNHDDSQLLPHVEEHFSPLMQNYFRGWEDSGSEMDMLWTGIIGYTADGQPYIGKVPGGEGEQYVIAGFNGGGMAVIFEAARGLARMVKDGVEYRESGLLGMWECTKERLEREIEDPEGRQ